MDINIKPGDVLIKKEPLEDIDTSFVKQEDNSLMCGICKRQFHEESKLQVHACCSPMTESVSFIVDQKLIPCNAELKKHIHSLAVNRSFTAKKRFTQMKKHLFKNTGMEKTFVCEICTKSFFYKNTLASHLRSHTEEELYACGLCPEKKIKENGSKPNGTRSVFCNMCQVTFSSKTSLNYHVRAHKNERLYACDVCYKTFNHASILKNHLITHTGQKPYACDLCCKTFNHASILKNHVKMHTEQKLYVCGICQRKFSQKGNLTSHLRIHTGEKPFVCDKCSKSFSWSASLKNHLFTHTRERPYACDYCKKTFIQKKNLTLHLCNHHSSKK